MNTTVVIMGSHPRTRMEFDWSRTDCDLWLFNEALSRKINTDGKENAWATRADAVFQMHQEVIWQNPGNRNDPGHYEWLCTQTEVKVYMQQHYDIVPMSERFPLEEIVARFGMSYFTSSPAYAIGLACYLGYKRIEVYGVEMTSNTEYQYQREAIALWLGVARGLGIEVDAHISMFEEQPLYGYEGEAVIPYERFGERVTELQPELDNLNARYKAAAHNTNRAFKNFSLSCSKENERELFLAVKAQVELGQELGKVDGALQENVRYREKADKMNATSGKYLFSRQEFETSAAKCKAMSAKQDTIFVAWGTRLGLVQDELRSTARTSRKREAVIAQFREALSRYFEANNKRSIYDGVAAENLRYMTYLDKRIRAAGGTKSEAVMLEALTTKIDVEAGDEVVI